MIITTKKTFVSELNPILSRLSENNRDFVTAGDYNFNLLHINHVNKEHFSDFNREAYESLLADLGWGLLKLRSLISP